MTIGSPSIFIQFCLSCRQTLKSSHFASITFIVFGPPSIYYSYAFLYVLQSSLFASQNWFYWKIRFLTSMFLLDANIHTWDQYSPLRPIFTLETNVCIHANSYNNSWHADILEIIIYAKSFFLLLIIYYTINYECFNFECKFNLNFTIK